MLNGRGKHFLSRNVAVGYEAERLSLRKARYKDAVNSDVYSYILLTQECGKVGKRGGGCMQ